MNVFIIIMRIFSLICLSSLLICGMYIGANKAKLTDYASSAKFHKTLGLVTAVFCTVTIFI